VVAGARVNREIIVNPMIRPPMPAARRYVMPAFDGSNVARDESYDWVTRNRDTLSRQRQEAAQRMIDKPAAERAAKTGRTEVTDRRTGSLIS
jgi:hypothetical protein